LYPKLAILDPELTLGLPEDVSITSGLDAISHACESAWNRNASPVSLGLVTRSLKLSLRALPGVVADPRDAAARSEMMAASLLAGLAISQTRTALSHAISYPLTANFGVPHGFACSFTLPAMLRFNAAVDDGRLAELATALGYSGTDDLSRALGELFVQLGVGKRLSAILPERASIMRLSDQMFAPGRAENNLREATEEQVRAVVAESLDQLGIES
jgi:alcohol dehydrogenase